MSESEEDAENLEPGHRAPPQMSRWIGSDVWYYLLRRPAIPTLVDTESAGERRTYEDRIRQRLGIAVEQYSVLNIHRIGIDAPARHVFEELLAWDGQSSCWPNHVATVERIGGGLDRVRLSLFGFHFRPLFSLRALKVHAVPDEGDFDNARYLLYDCGGGYPIGIFCLFVRSSIASEGETGTTQFFLAVGFDFFGIKAWSARNLAQRFWAMIHDRVTANVLNRFKELCEWRFQRLQDGFETRLPSNLDGDVPRLEEDRSGTSSSSREEPE